MIRSLVPRLVLLGLLQSGGADAQSQPAAEALFGSGKEAAEAGNWGLACDRFEESERLESAPGTQLNLARCREELGQLASAWKWYQEVVDRLPRSDSRAVYAEKKVKELSPRVPKLTLLAPIAEAPVTVILGDTVLQKGAFGVALPLDPGAVTVTVKADGYEDWVLEVFLAEGARVEQRLMAGGRLVGNEGQESVAALPVGDPSASERMSAPQGATEQGGAPRASEGAPLAWTLVGVGGAGVLVGVAGLIWSAIELGTVNAHCSEGLCDPEGLDAAARGRAAVAMSAIGWGVGATGLVSGVVLLRRHGSDAGTTAVLRAGAAPTVSGALLEVAGEW